MSVTEFSRRGLLKTAALGVAGATLNLGAVKRSFAAADLTVGIVYVGARDDFGWNQAHAVAIKSLKEVPGVKVVEEENVPETDAVSKSMESMINLDGAGLILATSFGYYTPFVVDLAKKYPDVQFRHAAPLWNKDKDPKNAGSYFGYLNQAHYVDGVAAGLCTKTNKIGFVAAKPIASVLSNINSVLLGARSTNPNATVQVIFTGDWSMPVREAEAANALVDAGCDVITCHVDGPKVVIETAEKRGVNELRPQCEPGAACAERLHHRRRIQVDHDLQGLRIGPRRRQVIAQLPHRRIRGRLRPEYAFRRGRDRARARRRRSPPSTASRRRSRSMSGRSRTTRPARSSSIRPTTISIPSSTRWTICCRASSARRPEAEGTAGVERASRNRRSARR